MQPMQWAELFHNEKDRNEKDRQFSFTVAVQLASLEQLLSGFIYFVWSKSKKTEHRSNDSYCLSVAKTHGNHIHQAGKPNLRFIKYATTIAQHFIDKN